MPKATFYLPPDAWEKPCLTADAAHHCKVLRLQIGQKIRLLNGCGQEGVAKILSLQKNAVDLEIIDSWLHPPRTKQIILAAAWTKALRHSWLLEKAVELEASAIWFWQAEHSQFPVPEDCKESWQNQLVAGAKQCHNPWLPSIRTFPKGIAEFLACAQSDWHKYLFLEKDYQSTPLTPDLLALSGTTLAVIGPEGGFAPVEVETLLAASFKPLSLGERILRYETAALLALGLHWWKAQL